MNYEQLGQLVITKFYSINHFYSQKKSGNTRHRRSSWAIVYKYDGETLYLNKKQEIVADKYNLAILPKGSSYKWTCTQSGHYYIVEFDCNYELKELFLCKINDSEDIKQILEAILREKNALNPFSNIKIIQLIYKMLYLLLKPDFIAGEQNSKRKIIDPAIKFINSHLNETIDNNELSKLCNVSTSYFRRIFTDVFETSPLKYIINLRISKAKELLQSDFVSVTQIAKQVGYDDVYHFSKLFKQKTGLSPLNYLKKKNN